MRGLAEFRHRNELGAGKAGRSCRSGAVAPIKRRAPARPGRPRFSDCPSPRAQARSIPGIRGRLGDDGLVQQAFAPGVRHRARRRRSGIRKGSKPCRVASGGQHRRRADQIAARRGAQDSRPSSACSTPSIIEFMRHQRVDGGEFCRVAASVSLRCSISPWERPMLSAVSLLPLSPTLSSEARGSNASASTGATPSTRASSSAARAGAARMRRFVAPWLRAGRRVLRLRSAPAPIDVQAGKGSGPVLKFEQHHRASFVDAATPNPRAVTDGSSAASSKSTR